MITAKVLPDDLPDALSSAGRYWATTKELASLTGQAHPVLRNSLKGLVDAGRLFSPARGLYVVVPPEFRSWKVTPATWFIDAMMKHLKRQYYVSFLSAASLHGASHQSPQVFSVVVSSHLEDRDIHRVHLRFVASERVRDMPTEQRTVQTGFLTVASPETTAVDLAWRPALGGGISNVATVLKELGELNAETLARIARFRGRATARRLGWLAERFRPDLDTYWLRLIAEPDIGNPTWLIPGQRRGALDKGWGIRINTAVEPDV